MKLGELIEARRTELGGTRGPLTMRELQTRARDAGYTLADTTISAFVKHPLPRMPKDDTIEALAVALDLDFDVVLAACAESKRRGPGSGELVQVAETPHVRAWITLTEGRTPAEREAMINVARTVAKALDEAHMQEANTNGVVKIDDLRGDAPHALRDVTT